MNGENLLKQNRIFPDIFSMLLLTLLVLVLFGKVIFSGETLYGSDFVLQFYPWKEFLYDTVRTKGSLPFWNPYLFSGTPFVANIQASMFYPLGFLYYLLPTDVAYLYSTIFHCILGALFMYLFMRTMKCSRSGSLLSGFIFVFNGYFIAHIYAGHLSFVQNYIWIPLVFVFLIKFLNTMKFKHAVLAGLVLAVQILGGFPQIAFYTILAIIACCLFYSIVHTKNGGYGRITGNGIGLFIILFVGFSVAAVQLMPTLEFSGLSGRAGGVSYQFATSDSLDFSDFLSFLLPDIFGNPVDQTYWKSGEGWHFWETCAYVGILPLFLICVRSRSFPLRQFRLFCILMITGALFLALGRHNPIYPFVYHLPGFGSFRIPSQIIFLYVFGISIMCGMGLHGLNQSDAQLTSCFHAFFFIAGGILLFLTIGLSIFPSDLSDFLIKSFAANDMTSVDMNKLYDGVLVGAYKGALVLFVSALLILLRKTGRMNLRLFNMLAVGIVIIDLYSFSDPFVQPYSFKTSAAKSDFVSSLSRSPAMGRVYADYANLLPNDALTYGFPSILGYDPLILKRYIEFIQTSQDQPLDRYVISLWKIGNPHAKLLTLLNLKQIVADQGIELMDNGIPYACFVGEAVFKNADEILSYMNSGQFDPLKVVVLESDKNGIAMDQVPKSLNGSYTLMKYDNEEIRLRASTDARGFLVMSEIFYPGWQATVDGKEVPVSRGNFIFRVIPLEKGRHEVVFRFVSRPFRFGVLISLVVLLGSIGFVWRYSRK